MTIGYGPMPNYNTSIFFIAREAELSKELKAVIADHMSYVMLGQQFLTPESTEEEICEIAKTFCSCGNYGRTKKRIQEALKSGKSIYALHIDNDNLHGFDEHVQTYINLWNTLLKREEGCIKLI